MYCGLSVKINTHKTPHGMRRLWTHFVCVCFHACGRQNPEYSNLNPMDDDTITLGGNRGLGSPLYKCGHIRPYERILPTYIFRLRQRGLFHMVLMSAALWVLVSLLVISSLHLQILLLVALSNRCNWPAKQNKPEFVTFKIHQNAIIFMHFLATSYC